VEHDRYEVQFLDDNTGWLIDRIAIWRTADGGAHWSMVYSEVPHQSNPWAQSLGTIKFINPSDGWRLDHGEIYRTNDSGSSWQQLPTPRDLQDIFEIEFLPDGKHGWLAGGRCKYVPNAKAPNRFLNACAGRFPSALVPSVLATVDGGKSWKRQWVSAAFGEISSIQMRDLNHGFATGEGGAFRYEHGKWIEAKKARPNRGRNDEHMGPDDGCLSIEIGAPTVAPTLFQFLDHRYGWLTNSNGYICRTIDGGRTWADIAQLNPSTRSLWSNYINALFISSSGDGFALDSLGAIQSTKDGGVNWEQLTAPDTFRGMFALDEKRIWLLNADGMYRLLP
jgi:photosystem II stability/assembly factor-like uncharacterized protein